MTADVAELAPALTGFRPPSGDPAALRQLASQLLSREHAQQDDVDHLGRECERLSAQWHGEAATAAAAALQDLRRHATRAASTHAETARVLITCAGRLEDAQATWEQAQALERRDALERAARETAAAAGAFVAPYDLDGNARRTAARRLAEDAQAEADAAIAAATAAIAELSDVARHDEPQDRPLTAAEQAAGFGRAAVDAVWGSLVALYGFSLPRLLTDPDGWHEQVHAVGEGASHAVRHPDGAADALLGLDLLRDGRYGEWGGGLVPDLVSGVLSGGTLPGVRRGLDVAEDLSDLAEDVDDLQRVDGRGVAGIDANAGGPVELPPGAQLRDGYVTHVEDLTPERRTHILDGDPPDVRGGKGGGHRSGTGKPTKTEFPADWSDDDIIRRVMDVARTPSSGLWQSDRNTFLVTGERAGVTVHVVVNRHGRVVTAFPELGGPGVVRNPRE